ncbi:class I SAM-dependent methyltransferase [Amycolatopsis sp. NBC_00355]|uniref:class I SAM-dependent methyltransferase n=1 Tax=Amycolatopsis sp. NBC_00355 TaxID=2975957 RepID=UPI002E25E182
MELTESNLFYRHPQLYDQVQADPQHTAATTCEELVDTFGPANARTLVDFGCGTGRDLDRLAKRFDCMGVDALPPMVDYAARERPHLDIRQGDVRSWRLGRTVDVITALGNLLSYLHDNTDLQQAFDTFATHAHPGTLLILDTPIAPIEAEKPTGSRVDTADLHADVTITYTWDLRTQINTMHRHWRHDDGREEHDEIPRRILGPRELELYAAATGFTMLDIVDHRGRRDADLVGPSAYIVARLVHP